MQLEHTNCKRSHEHAERMTTNLPKIYASRPHKLALKTQQRKNNQHTTPGAHLLKQHQIGIDYASSKLKPRRAQLCTTQSTHTMYSVS
jgi:hypothetical protein